MNTLHIITGSPGAGKTTFGRKLAAEKQAAFLDIDTCTETVVQASLSAMKHDPNDRDSPFFKSAFREPIYETLFNIAEENLAHCDVVITGPFTKERNNPDWLNTLSQRFKTPVVAYYVQCSPEIQRQRLISRNNPRDLPKLENWETFLQYYGEDTPPVYQHTIVDTSNGEAL